MPISLMMPSHTVNDGVMSLFSLFPGTKHASGLSKQAALDLICDKMAVNFGLGIVYTPSRCLTLVM